MLSHLLAYSNLRPLSGNTHYVINPMEHNMGVYILMLNQNLESDLVESDASSRDPLHSPSFKNLAQSFFLDNDGCSIQFVKHNIHVDLCFPNMTLMWRI